MTIQNELNKIKTAVLGKDVRTAIHDSIEKTYNDATESGNANMEVEMARGTHINLNDRLNVTDNKIDLTTNKINATDNNLNTRIDNIIATPTMVSEQEIIDARQSKTSLGANLTTIKDDLVAHKEDYAAEMNQLFILSSNLFNKDTIIPGYGINTITGELVANATVNTTPLIKIKPNTIYTKSEASSRIAFYDNNSKFISSAINIATVASPINSIYARLIITVETNIIPYRLNEGGVLLPYEEYYKSINIENINNESISNTKLMPIDGSIVKGNSITIDKLNFIKKSSNLINKDKAKLGFGIDNATGIVVENSTTYLCDWIVVKENTSYVRSEGSIRCGFYDADKKFITSIVAEKITTPANTAFIRLVVPIEPFKNNTILLQLNEGDVLSGEPYAEYIDPKYIYTPTFTSFGSHYAFSPEIPHYNYVSELKPSCNGTDPLGFNGDNTLVADIYTKYDELVIDNSEYITKVTAMNDHSGIYPLNSYVFKPEIPVKLTGYQDLPTIILVAGLHGNGTDPSGDPLTSIFSLYHLMEDICNGWRTSEALEYFRWNVNFVIIPVANPWGVENKSRLNSRAVDLNRNFDYLHSGASSIYKGVNAFSENESQHIRDIVMSNKDNTILFMDLHTIGGLEFINNRYLLRYVLNSGKDIYNITNYTLGKMSRIWRGNHVTSTLTFNGLFSINENEPMMKSWTEKVVGIPSGLIEMFDASDKYRVKNGAENITMNVEHLGNYLINAIRYFIQKND